MQGIREVIVDPDEALPMSTETTANQGVYLNRANDGFVCFDCGTFSHGPVDLNSGSAGALLGNDDQPSTFLTSVSISSKERVQLIGTVVLDGDDSEDGKAFTTLSARRFRKASFQDAETGTDEDLSIETTDGNNNSNDGADDAERKNGNGNDTLDGVAILTKLESRTLTRCRMPSSNQPWMMQRVKWEKQQRVTELSEATDESDKDKDISALASRPMTAFASCQQWQNSNDIPQDLLADLNLSLDTRPLTIFMAGVECTDGSVRSVVRAYNGEGKLVSVTNVEGERTV